MFSSELMAEAEGLLAAMRAKRLSLVTAESCTGGLVTALLTEIPGSSDVVDRGFVTYTNAAKIELLGVPAAVIERHGAVSAAVAVAMTEGALRHSHATVSVAVTGIAGPGGGTAQKPVGLVYIAAQRQGSAATVQRFQFHDETRHGVRIAAVAEALQLVRNLLA